MSISPTFILAKLRHRRKRRAVEPAPTPPAGNHILSVTGGFTDMVIVTLSAGVTEIDPVMDALWVSVDGGTWSPATAADLSDSPVVRFTVPETFVAYQFWHVEDATAYHMADGQPLLGPFDGSITS
jgi:hypothetical protein